MFPPSAVEKECQGTRDPLFLTGVTFPAGYPLCEETRVKLTVYDQRDLSSETVTHTFSFHRQLPRWQMVPSEMSSFSCQQAIICQLPSATRR
ncbi:type II inositol 3,4-bisphosphate 4-phosphatase isoform X1 [Arapaima gigas]